MLSEAEWSGVGTDSTEEQSEPERPGTLGTRTLLFSPHTPVSVLILIKTCNSRRSVDRTCSHLTRGGGKT